jgi:adenylate kinase family enzyme
MTTLMKRSATGLRCMERETAPLIDYYRRQGLLRCIVGVGTIDEIFQRITIVL